MYITMSRFGRRYSALAPILFLLLMLPACSGEEDIVGPGRTEDPSDAEIRVEVTDAFGSEVSATVSLVQSGRTLLDGSKAQDERMRFINLDAGTYTVKASRSGFLDAEQTISLSTSELEEITIALKPESLPIVGVTDSRLISANGNSATFEVDVLVLDRDSNPVAGLGGASFNVPDGTFPSGAVLDFTLQSAQLTTGGSQGPYSAILLMDQSGSITSTDPNDSRVQASKIFLNAMGGGDEVLLAAFAEGGDLQFDLTSWGSFTSQGTSYFPTLDALANLEGGGTNLYDAISAFVDKASSEGRNANRAVIVFTDGEDTASQLDIQDVVDRAVSQNVRVYMVGLADADVSVLAEIASGTDGGVMRAADARQLVSLYGTLSDVLHGTAGIYRTRWSVTSTQNSFNSGGWFQSGVQVQVPGEGTLSAPFRVNIP